MKDRYPGSTWKGDGKTSGPYTSGPFKVVLHTTETRSMPGYRDGYSAPHMTYDPSTRVFTQHTLFTKSARSLRNGPHPAQTNRDSAIQLEIICYSAKGIAIGVGGLPVDRLSQDNLNDIREFLLWCRDEFGVKMKWPGRKALSYSEANAPGFRMPMAVWDNYGGVCAHQHIGDGNTHWDTGDLDWDALITEEDEEMLKRGDNGDAVRFYQEALLRWNPDALPNFGADGDYGNETVEWVKSFQLAAGLEMNGQIGGVTADMMTANAPADFAAVEAEIKVVAITAGTAEALAESNLSRIEKLKLI